MSNYERDEQRRQEMAQERQEEKAWNMTGSAQKMSQSPQYNPTLRYDDPTVKELRDPVEHPAHYTFGKIEVLDAIEDWGLDYHRGNILKYLVRAGKKGDKLIEDLRKARFYLDRYIRLHQEHKDGIDYH
mgnify:CR=1 FL=1|tara:strand:+ start:40 stop:426 length:387 start_codon:yes stop_codon:yes gene_type:complete